ncbi:hypothetical protein Runsl_5716 (plasmid) [Runella slithyformis DSM 19594]|uniref:Uncharacterized protein n=1 Tax=Runella slithyformis (strain ATCC 29530 / DSM 19594 / LMG 11500 / NCIMB 11436 / LSU 4) TaxID=761193 RepID=A0A7U4E8S9_RUNSL|nr:hypothetical protein Runsl_5716 [Runella slithyformis DSM 19594]
MPGTFQNFLLNFIFRKRRNMTNKIMVFFRFGQLIYRMLSKTTVLM